jgi:hypothetical protein
LEYSYSGKQETAAAGSGVFTRNLAVLRSSGHRLATIPRFRVGTIYAVACSSAAISRAPAE